VAQREIFFFVKLCALCGFVAKKSSMLIRGLTFGADRYVFEQDWIVIFKYAKQESNIFVISLLSMV
jgi:hypothetical protein